MILMFLITSVLSAKNWCDKKTEFAEIYLDGFFRVQFGIMEDKIREMEHEVCFSKTSITSLKVRTLELLDILEIIFKDKLIEELKDCDSDKSKVCKEKLSIKDVIRKEKNDFKLNKLRILKRNNEYVNELALGEKVYKISSCNERCITALLKFYDRYDIALSIIDARSSKFFKKKLESNAKRIDEYYEKLKQQTPLEIHINDTNGKNILSSIPEYQLVFLHPNFSLEGVYFKNSENKKSFKLKPSITLDILGVHYWDNFISGLGLTVLYSYNYEENKNSDFAIGGSLYFGDVTLGVVYHPNKVFSKWKEGNWGAFISIDIFKTFKSKKSINYYK